MSDKLAIGFLSHHASPAAPTGAERSLALLAQGMRRRGHRVVVVVPGRWALAASLREAGVEVETIRSRSCWMTYYDRRPWPVAAAKWLRWSWPQRARSRIARFLTAWGPDVVHVNCLPHLAGAAAAAASGRPVVWHLREILPPGRRRRWLAGFVAERATIAVAVSEAVGEWLRAEGLGDRLRVVPNGVERSPAAIDAAEARGELALPREGVLFGLYGQLMPHKGAMAFIEAARQALRDEPDLRFVLAGAGPETFRRRVRDAIAAGGFAERFHLLPPQDNSDLLLAAADVVCLATTTPDPLPRAVLEAMAAARPVAAFRSGGTPEMVVHDETGLLVPTGDVEGLGRAFVRLARDAALRRSMGQAGARRVRESFSMDLHLERLEAIFRGLLR